MAVMTESRKRLARFTDSSSRCVPSKLVVARGGMNESLEERAGCPVLLNRAFGMPLHRHHEMIGQSAFQRFNDAVLRAAGNNAQPISNGIQIGRASCRERVE